jgi:hypothetical protein
MHAAGLLGRALAVRFLQQLTRAAILHEALRAWRMFLKFAAISVTGQYNLRGTARVSHSSQF